jgi:hypothetical protein
MKYYLLLWLFANLVSCNNKKVSLDIFSPHHSISWHDLLENDFYVEKDLLGTVVARKEVGNTTYFYEFSEIDGINNSQTPYSYRTITKIELDSIKLVNFFEKRNCELIGNIDYYQPSNSFSFYVKCKNNNLFFSIHYSKNGNFLQISYDYPIIKD